MFPGTSLSYVGILIPIILFGTAITLAITLAKVGINLIASQKK